MSDKRCFCQSVSNDDIILSAVPEGSLSASEAQVVGTVEIQPVLITEACDPAGCSAYSRNWVVGLDPGMHRMP